MIIAIVEDLFFASKIDATAHALGVTVRMARRQDELCDATHATVGAIVDLTLTSTDPIALISSLRQAHATLPIVGFVPHVQAETARAARAAGASTVLPRSKFAETLPQILRALAAGESP
ncbi:MAG: hypothetical protein U1D55_15530 [Phycisphaerae bacterium]